MTSEKRNPTRFRFSKTRIDTLPIPSAGRAEYRDLATPGLVLRVTANGAKSFCLFRRVNGRPARMTLGTFPSVTVEQAQRRVHELQGDITKGIDPRLGRREARNEPTLAALFGYWLESHAKQHKRTWAEDERQYNVFLKSWGARGYPRFARPTCNRCTPRWGARNGHYAANRLLALVRAMFNKAPDIGFTGSNPAAGIKKFSEESATGSCTARSCGCFLPHWPRNLAAILRVFLSPC